MDTEVSFWTYLPSCKMRSLSTKILIGDVIKGVPSVANTVELLAESRYWDTCGDVCSPSTVLFEATQGRQKDRSMLFIYLIYKNDVKIGGWN